MDGTIEELIKEGEQAQDSIERQVLEYEQRAKVEEKNRREVFMQLLRNCLPPAVHPYLRFEQWHTPYYDERLLWDSQALIGIPNLAPVRIYCMTSRLDEPENAAVYLYDRHGNDPFEVLDFACEFDSYGGEFHVRKRLSWKGNNIFIALAHAKRLGDNSLIVQMDVDHRNQERAAEPFKQEEVVVSASEALLNAFRDFIIEEIQHQRRMEQE
jgi:hypothetical protein